MKAILICLLAFQAGGDDSDLREYLSWRTQTSGNTYEVFFCHRTRDEERKGVVILLMAKNGIERQVLYGTYRAKINGKGELYCTFEKEFQEKELRWVETPTDAKAKFLVDMPSYKDLKLSLVSVSIANKEVDNLGHWKKSGLLRFKPLDGDSAEWDEHPNMNLTIGGIDWTGTKVGKELGVWFRSEKERVTGADTKHWFEFGPPEKGKKEGVVVFVKEQNLGRLGVSQMAAFGTYKRPRASEGDIFVSFTRTYWRGDENPKRVWKGAEEWKEDEFELPPPIDAIFKVEEEKDDAMNVSVLTCYSVPTNKRVEIIHGLLVRKDKWKFDHKGGELDFVPKKISDLAVEEVKSWAPKK